MALFTDRTRGARLAKRVLADMPMPKLKNVSSPMEVIHARRKAL
jgi:hypothetical protein